MPQLHFLDIIMSVNYFDDLSSIESSSCRERRYSADDCISGHETAIKALTYAVQRLAGTLETKEEERQKMDHDLKVKVQDLLKENAVLRNQVADLKEEGTGTTAVIGVENDKNKNTSLPMSHNNPLSKLRKDQQRTPATSCDLTSGEEAFDCESTIVHLLASHCSEVSSSSRQVTPSPSFTSNQRSTACTGHLRKLPKVRGLRLVGCRGVGRRPSRGGRRPLAWIYSPFIPRRIITTKETGHDGVSDLSYCM